AIPVHLLTLEALDMYLHKIAPDGVVCVHTSNRHLHLIRVVNKLVEVLNSKYKARNGSPYQDDPLYGLPVKCKVGKDYPLAPEGGGGGERSKFLGQFSSEYVMVYHDEKYLKPPEDYTKKWNIYEQGPNVQKINIIRNNRLVKNPDQVSLRSNVDWY